MNDADRSIYSKAVGIYLTKWIAKESPFVTDHDCGGLIGKFPLSPGLTSTLPHQQRVGTGVKLY